MREAQGATTRAELKKERGTVHVGGKEATMIHSIQLHRK